MRNKKVIVDGIACEYIESEKQDKDNTILFLHGWMQDASSFLEIMKNLERNDVSFASLSFPWFWWTDFPSPDWWIFDYAEFTSKFIEKLWLVKPMLVWHSFGWRVSIILWSESDNLSKIVFIWAAGIELELSASRKIVTTIWKTIFSLPGLRDVWNKIKQKIWSSDYNSAGKLSEIFKKVVNTDLSHLLEKIKAPCLLIWWDTDDQAPIENAIIMDNKIPDSRLERFSEWSHFVFQEYPNEVTDLILNFYKKDDI